MTNLIFMMWLSFASQYLFSSNILLSGNQSDEVEATLSLTADHKAVIRILDSFSKPQKKNQFDTITQTTDLEVPGLHSLSSSSEIFFETNDSRQILCVNSKGQPSGHCEIQIKKNNSRATITLSLKENP